MYRRAEVGGGELEPVYVDLRRELEHLVPKLDCARVERAPRDVDGLMEVVRRRGRPAIAPEHVHHLLAVEAVARRESEELHELARLLQPPGRLRNGHPVDGGCEAAQKDHADVGHRAENDLPTSLLDGGRVFTGAL